MAHTLNIIRAPVAHTTQFTKIVVIVNQEDASVTGRPSRAIRFDRFYWGIAACQKSFIYSTDVSPNRVIGKAYTYETIDSTKTTADGIASSGCLFRTTLVDKPTPSILHMAVIAKLEPRTKPDHICKILKTVPLQTTRNIENSAWWTRREVEILQKRGIVQDFNFEYFFKLLPRRATRT